MQSHDTVSEEIMLIIADIAKKEVAEIKPKSDLLDLGLDSLSWLDILAAVEKKYSIQIPDDDLANIKNLSGLIGSVKKQLTVRK